MVQPALIGQPLAERVGFELSPQTTEFPKSFHHSPMPRTTKSTTRIFPLNTDTCGLSSNATVVFEFTVHF